MKYCPKALNLYPKDIQCLEKIQRCTTKMIIGVKTKTYEERLRVIGLTTFEIKTMRENLLETYKLIDG